MLNIPTGKPLSDPPGEAFKWLLNTIISSPSSAREAKIKPHLLTFIAHPIIKDLLAQSEPPAPTQAKSDNLDLQKIQDSLSMLAKAVESLKKGAPPQKPQTPKKPTQKGAPTPTPTRPTYLAIAGTRPPNPSLVVDLAKSGLDQSSWVKPEKLLS